MAFIA